MKVVVHLPEGKVQEFTVPKTKVTMGRGNVCDIVLPYEGFSRRHAEIEIVEGEVFVTDLGSTNGVFIDGERIPANTRTQLQTFLTLQIGPAQQVEVIDDSAANLSSPMTAQMMARTNPHIQRPEPKEQTRTTQMDPRLLRKPRRKKETKESKLPMFLLPVLILAGAVYYYNMNGDEAATQENAPVEVVKEAPPVTEASFLSTAMLDSLMKNASCKGELEKWCKEAGVLEASKEGVVIEGKTLVIYMNMTAFKNQFFSEAFNALDEDQRLEILSLRRVFDSTVVRALSRQTQLDTIQVVTGMEEGDELKVRMALKIRRDIDPKKSDKFKLYDLFDLILNEGKLENLSELSSLYEKLPLQ